jgi:hypothetical protein
MNTCVFCKDNFLGAILMIMGCCIGAGMIGMPIICTAAGFLPSSVAIVATYLFTTSTGLLLLEAILWFDQSANLLSVANAILGWGGKVVMGVLFGFLFYAIFVAYLDGSGEMLRSILIALGAEGLSRELRVGICLICVAMILRNGIRGVDLCNRVLLVGLIVAYCLIIESSVPHVKLENLRYVNWKAALGTLPILFICFGYQNLVPSLVHYLKKDGDDPDCLESQYDPERLLRLENWMKSQLTYSTELIFTEKCFYTSTPTEAFVIAPLAYEPRIILGAACGGHGFKFAPLTGKALKDLALFGETDAYA